MSMEERREERLPGGVPAGPVPVPRQSAPQGLTPEQMQAQLSAIRALDPEISELKDLMTGEAGEKFRQYVNRGLDFVDAYTLAARDRLRSLRDRRTEASVRASLAGKDHLSATATRGEGGVSVPRAELEMIRLLNPGVSDAEIRRYYAADRQRMEKR